MGPDAIAPGRPASGRAWHTYLPAVFFTLVPLLFAGLAIAANADLSAGRFALFMDERITFDGVRRITHPASLQSFLWSVADGGDHRYGRSLWNSMAAFSFLPQRIWGDPGQIIAGRTLQVLFLLGAGLTFALGLARNWPVRLVMVVAIFGMPYADYYATMPKPEPLQCLLLAIFCVEFVRSRLAFGWYWIFAGLAFGTKISTLPALLVFVLFALFSRWRQTPEGAQRGHPCTALGAALLGLGLAVPILLPTALAGALGAFLAARLRAAAAIRVPLQLLIAAAWAVVAYLTSRREIALWFASTFLNTTHGADSPSINAWSWISFFFTQWLLAPVWLGALLALMVATAVSPAAYDCLRHRSDCHRELGGLAITLAGMALNLGIFVGAHRLWGFYLYPGTLLTLVGALTLLDAGLARTGAARPEPGALRMMSFDHGLLAVLLAVTLIYWWPHTASALRQLALRTRTPEYLQQYQSYQQVMEFLGTWKAAGGRRMIVMHTPSLFPPDDSDRYQIVDFWGPYTRWTDRPDVLIFGLVNTPRGGATPPDSPGYASFLVERQGYAAHVARQGERCRASPCFERQLLLPDGGEILTLQH
jgi:hypothetical protein